jgi:predicted transcriptional regulator
MAMSKSPDPELTHAEWTVMNAVWREEPSTARSVLDAVCRETGWAYSTVKTYEPRLAQRSARHGAIRLLLKRAFGGAAGSMAHFLLGSERLSAKERRDLIRLLQKQEGKPK